MRDNNQCFFLPDTHLPNTHPANTHTAHSRYLPYRGLLPRLLLLAGGCLPLGLTQAQAIDEIVVYDRLDVNALQLNQSNEAGSRLGLSALELPGSVETISSSEITLKGDYGSLSAVTRSTGIVSSASPGNGGTSMSARGFNGHSSIVNTYDGTRLYVGAGTVTFPADTWTLARVEILRGPGAVVNGVGATGATINYITKSPKLGESDVDLLLSAGSFNTQRLGIGFNTGLSENTALRVDAVHHQTDGYVDRADETRDVLSSSLLLQAADDIQLKFNLDYANIDAAPYWGTPLINGQASDTVRKNNYNVSDGVVEYEDLWPRVRLEWQLNDKVRFRNDTFYVDAERHWRNVEGYAFDGVSQINREFYLEIFHDQKQTGTRSDFLIDSEFAGLDNKLSVGGEFNRIEFQHTNNSPFGGSSSVAIDGFDPGIFLPVDPTTLDFLTDTDQFALFFDDVLQLNQQWSVVVGGRFDNIDYQRRDVARSNGQSAGFFDADFSEMSWRIGAVYQPTEALSLYAQASTGPDSIGSLASLNVSQQNLDLTKGQQLELGIKQVFWEGRGEYTVAVYTISKQDLFTQTNAASQVEQIGEQSAQGIELTLALRATDNLAFDFNIAHVDAEFDDFAALSGNTPANVPDVSANAWLVWTPSSAIQIAGGLRYVDERFADNGNTERLPDYLVVDASVNWQLSESINLSLRGRNLSDEENYIISRYDVQQWIFTDPRAYEISVNFAW